MNVELYQKREHPADMSMPSVPESEWKQWMKQLNIVRIVLIANVTMTEKAPGLVSVTVKDESTDIPNITSTGDRTAILGPMTIELEPVEVVPPMPTKQGLLKYVYFDVNSSELDKVVVAPPDPPKHQGNDLVTWIRESLT